MTPLRLALRALVAVALLAAVDAGVRAAFPDPDYRDAYRLPKNASIESLGPFVEHVEAEARRDDRTVAVFLGASPTYGHRIEDPRNTWSESFERAARSKGLEFEAYNMASNGRFLGDERVIAERVADADVVYVQLTYHTLNPRSRRGELVRHPELPRLLAVGLSGAEARELGVDKAYSSLSLPLERLMRANWALYRHREAVDAALFGGPPRRALAQGRLRVKSDDDAGLVEDRFASFEELDPGEQMIVISGYAEESSFELSASDPSVRVLRALARRLRERGARAVFYLSPLNRELVDGYELIDRTQYARNISVLRHAVVAEGGEFLDYNLGRPRFRPEHFADVSHTTDEGGVAVGQALFADTESLLREAAARMRSQRGSEWPSTTIHLPEPPPEEVAP